MISLTLYETGHFCLFLAHAEILICLKILICLNLVVFCYSSFTIGKYHFIGSVAKGYYFIFQLLYS